MELTQKTREACFMITAGCYNCGPVKAKCPTMTAETLVDGEAYWVKVYQGRDAHAWVVAQCLGEDEIGDIGFKVIQCVYNSDLGITLEVVRKHVSNIVRDLEPVRNA
jgi:hypothetical protein